MALTVKHPFLMLEQFLIRRGCTLISSCAVCDRDAVSIWYRTPEGGNHNCVVPLYVEPAKQVKLLAVHIQLARSYSRAEEVLGG